jgi:hypothetical protein
MTLDEFGDILTGMLDELPEVLLDELNGGVLVEPGAKRSPAGRGIFILGEYHRDYHLGRMIVLYYGSFLYLYGSSRERWIAEMRATLRHEIRHHIEDRAGLRDLEREDLEDIRRFLEGEGRN